MTISLDYIPVKIFFKILETNNFEHFSKKKKHQEALREKWDDLVEEYELLIGNRRITKDISIKSKIEILKLKFRVINNVCEALAYTYIEDGIELLKKYYFFINKENYQSELQRIKKESQSILIQIKKLESQLPKEKESNDKKDSQHIDKIIIGYSSFVQFLVKPNKCTVTEFISLKQLFEEKIKELQKPVKNGR